LALCADNAGVAMLAAAIAAPKISFDMFAMMMSFSASRETTTTVAIYYAEEIG
jgi:hypothetical protein